MEVSNMARSHDGEIQPGAVRSANVAISPFAVEEVAFTRRELEMFRTNDVMIVTCR